MLPFKLDWLTSGERVWEEGCGWALLPEGQISRRGEPLLRNRGPRSWRVAYEYSCFGAAVTRGAQAGVFWSFVPLWLQKGEGSKPCVCPLRFTTLWPIVEQFASPLAWKGTAELQEPSAAAGCLCWGAFWCILLAIPLSSEPWQKAPSSLYGRAAGAVLGDLCWELAASVENRLWHLSHTSVPFCPPQINISNPHQMYLFVVFFLCFSTIPLEKWGCTWAVDCSESTIRSVQIWISPGQRGWGSCWCVKAGTAQAASLVVLRWCPFMWILAQPALSPVFLSCFFKALWLWSQNYRGWQLQFLFKKKKKLLISGHSNCT